MDLPKSKPKFSPFQRLFIVPLPKIGPPSRPRPDREGITAESSPRPTKACDHPVGDGFQPSRPPAGDRSGLIERTSADAGTVRRGQAPALRRRAISGHPVGAVHRAALACVSRYPTSRSPQGATLQARKYLQRTCRAGACPRRNGGSRKWSVPSDCGGCRDPVGGNIFPPCEGAEVFGHPVGRKNAPERRLRGRVHATVMALASWGSML